MRLEEALETINISLSQYLDTARNFPEVQSQLEKFKHAVRRQYKQLVLKYHPDTNPQVDDNLIKKINEAKDILLRLRVEPRVKPRPQIITIRVKNPVTWAYDGTDATSATGGSMWTSVFDL